MNRAHSYQGILWLLALVSGLCLPAPMAAQAAGEVVRVTLGQSVAPLHGPWKFHLGDSPDGQGLDGPEWAQSDFDDSQWETVDLMPKDGSFDPNTGQAGYEPGWTAKGHPGYWGYAWYRIRVAVDAPAGDALALAGPRLVDDAYQVFVDGRLLGGLGEFSGARLERPVAYGSQPVIFRFPNGVAGGDGRRSATQVVAFRMWMEPSTLALAPDAGGLHTAPLLGTASAIRARYQLQWVDMVRSYAASPVLAGLFFLLALIACSLILFDRSDRVYLWLAGVLLLSSLHAAGLVVAVFTNVLSLTLGWINDEIFSSLILGGWVAVWWVWFRLRRPGWMPWVIVGLTLLAVTTGVLGKNFFFTVIPLPVGATLHFTSTVIRLLFVPLLIYIVFRGVREQGQEGWLVLPAVVVIGMAQFQYNLELLHFRVFWFPYGVQIALSDVANLVGVAAIFVLLVRRMLLSVRRQRELALDVKQAQEVQRVLLPEPVRVHGLVIESEYRPAREVGGDFFQVVPQPGDGSVLIVVGDVAGKGLPAGMLVALLIGAVRTIAEVDTDPEFVLSALNRRLIGRNAALVTCLALRIEAGGAATLANAGHLPPYLNGVEVEMEGALPLGGRL